MTVRSGVSNAWRRRMRCGEVRWRYDKEWRPLDFEQCRGEKPRPVQALRHSTVTLVGALEASDAADVPSSFDVASPLRPTRHANHSKVIAATTQCLPSLRLALYSLCSALPRYYLRMSCEWNNLQKKEQLAVYLPPTATCQTKGPPYAVHQTCHCGGDGQCQQPVFSKNLEDAPPIPLILPGESTTLPRSEHRGAGASSQARLCPSIPRQNHQQQHRHLR